MIGGTQLTLSRVLLRKARERNACPMPFVSLGDYRCNSVQSGMRKHTPFYDRRARRDESRYIRYNQDLGLRSAVALSIWKSFTRTIIALICQF